MQLVVIVTVIVGVTFNVPVNRAQTVLESSLTRECWRLGYVYQCEDSTYSRDAADLSLNCGQDYFVAAENYAALCTKNDAGNYRLNLPEYQFGTDESNRLSERIMMSCSPIVTAPSSASCSAECRSALLDLVEPQGCCFQTVFNERLSQLILGHDVDVFINACNITAPAPCDSSSFGELTVSSDAESCTYEEFWTRIIDYNCRPSVAQPYLDALVKNSTCIPLARHTVNTCGRGPNNTLCLDLFGTSFNPVFPERTIRLNPLANAVSVSCANYSSFQSEGCPLDCKNALETAVDELGCCLNLFNDDVNEVLIPYFSDDVMEACEVTFPPQCKSDLVIR